jgi:biotin carboxyl carrier protein
MENSGNNFLLIDDTEYQTKFHAKFLRRKKYEMKDEKKITAFIPGTIKQIYVKAGMTVKRGDKLLVLEAMKMENNLIAPINGIVKAVYVDSGQLVMKDALLVEIE